MAAAKTLTQNACSRANAHQTSLTNAQDSLQHVPSTAISALYPQVKAVATLCHYARMVIAVHYAKGPLSTSHPNP